MMNSNVILETPLLVWNGEARSAASSGRGRPESGGSPQLVVPRKAGETRSEYGLLPAELGQVVDQMNQTMAAKRTDIQFQIDQRTALLVVKVVVKSTGEVIRQFPSEHALKVAEALANQAGALVDDGA